ncbi:MAG TPA: OmpA family protein [Niabella sp.]|nr:OmpA family protein [Niabella sp.]
MSINIVDLVKNYISQDLISKAGAFLGENEGGISKAVSGLIPSILGGVVAKGTGSEANAQQLLDAAKEANNSGLLGNLSSLFGNADLLSKGTGWFNSLFGGQSNSIIDTISNFAGIKSSSSSSLISMVTPLIMALLGKKAQDDNLTASGFSGFLSSQRSSVLSALPSGLSSVAASLGLGSIGSAARETVEDVKTTAASAYNYTEGQAEKAGGGMKWLLPLLLLAALAFLLWWVMGKGCNKGEGTTGADTTATAPVDTNSATLEAVTASGTLDTATGNYIYNVGSDKEIKLADGTTLLVGENSTEARLYNMLSDAAFTVDTVNKSANWVVLDRVYFETGKSVLTASSAAQVKNIAAILKNFPNAAIKLGGYTDNTGDAAVNKKVSLERAKAVAGELVKAGAPEKQVVEAEGYGPEFPVCAANDTPECQAQNRRVDLKVAVK